MKFKSETSSYCNLQPEIAIHRPEIEPNKLTENIFHLQYHNFIEIIKNIRDRMKNNCIYKYGAEATVSTTRLLETNYS